MAAHDNATATIDTNEMTYVDRHGNNHVINNGQTFVFELAASGSSEVYKVSASGSSLTTTSGTVIDIDADPRFTWFIVDTDATAKTNAGSIWFYEPDGFHAEWSITTVTIDDIDEPTSLTATLTRQIGDMMYTISLSGITLEQ